MMIINQDRRVMCCHTIRCELDGELLLGISGNNIGSPPIKMSFHPSCFNQVWYPLGNREVIIENLITTIGNFDDVPKTGPLQVQWGAIETRTVVAPVESVVAVTTVTQASAVADEVITSPVIVTEDPTNVVADRLSFPSVQEGFIRSFCLIPPVLLSTIIHLSHDEGNLFNSRLDLYSEMLAWYEEARSISTDIGPEKFLRIQAVINNIVTWIDLSQQMYITQVATGEIPENGALSYIIGNVPRAIEDAIHDILVGPPEEVAPVVTPAIVNPAPAQVVVPATSTVANNNDIVAPSVPDSNVIVPPSDPNS